MDEVLDAVARSLTDAGFPSHYDEGVLTVCGCEFHGHQRSPRSRTFRFNGKQCQTGPNANMKGIIAGILATIPSKLEQKRQVQDDVSRLEAAKKFTGKTNVYKYSRTKIHDTPFYLAVTDEGYELIFATKDLEDVAAAVDMLQEAGVVR